MVAGAVKHIKRGLDAGPLLLILAQADGDTRQLPGDCNAGIAHPLDGVAEGLVVGEQDGVAL